MARLRRGAMARGAVLVCTREASTGRRQRAYDSRSVTTRRPPSLLGARKPEVGHHNDHEKPALQTDPAGVKAHEALTATSAAGGGAEPGGPRRRPDPRGVPAW